MDTMTSTITSSATSRIVNAGKVAAVIAATGAAIAACGDDGGSTSASTTTAAATSTTTGSTAAESTAAQGGSTSPYADGEYSATGTYNSPGGEQSVGVTVTLSNSVITALTLDTSQTKGTSAEFQAKFASGIDSLVVGKSIDELDVSKVSGSSLTSGGFNNAIDEIKSEAKA
ncbi:MAG: calcium-binding protein [Gordonia sp.]|nr:calcium-binding protein [Gordonia sp. (in: high G+C Gram-positive bacteria)]OZG26505.1 calcium-binding protein [Williamsia sp. 1138]